MRRRTSDFIALTDWTAVGAYTSHPILSARPGVIGDPPMLRTIRYLMPSSSRSSDTFIRSGQS